MGVSRAAWSAAALVLGALAAGCGGSVADTDAPLRNRTSSPPPSPFCAAVRANSDAIRPLNDLTRNGIPAKNLAATIDAVRFTGADLVNTAPADLRADVQRTVEAVNLQLDALVAAGGNAGATARDPAVTARLNAPELAAASKRVGSYVAQNCGPAVSPAR
jgi:hypothetical protein